MNSVANMETMVINHVDVSSCGIITMGVVGVPISNLKG